MASLYKYLKRPYAEQLVQEGKILFRPLSYFRAVEDGNVRGDVSEGHYRHSPNAGLQINNLTTGETLVSDLAFNSQVRFDDIFIYCLSLEKSAKLAKQFGADACVEVHNTIKFVRLLRAALTRIPGQDLRIPRGLVKYDAETIAPGVHWALPDQIMMHKHSHYSDQQEFRIGFCQNGAFDVENVNLTLTKGELPPPQTSAVKDVMRFLELGDLRKVCKMHVFD